MQTNMPVNRAGLVAVVAGVLAMTSVQPSSFAAQRPLDDFLSRQGHWCLGFDSSGNVVCPSTYGDLACGFLFTPPSPNFIAWTAPNANTTVSMDYAGVQDAVLGGILGTTISGSINERPLADGRAEVAVQLHTRNALTWAVQGVFPGNDPVLFGARITDVQNGATPALGDCTFYVKFINSAPGADLPDLIELYICRFQDFEALSISGQANGSLANGHPGRLEVTQKGLITIAGVANPNSRVALDAFPVEQVIIRAVGK